jgi:hypothetical protein
VRLLQLSGSGARIFSGSSNKDRKKGLNPERADAVLPSFRLYLRFIKIIIPHKYPVRGMQFYENNYTP